MTVAYFDSSALVKLLLDEDGSEVAARAWDAADAVASSSLAYPEVRAALAAALRGRQLGPDQYVKVKGTWRQFWAAVRVVAPGDAVVGAAGDLAESQALHGYDAVHLASALRLAEMDSDPIMVAWDERLRSAASGLGLRTVPAGGEDAGGETGEGG